ncbi:hypothetical protein KQX54_018439 [Cotesia glomerata]|uniref:Uncharacterized protein n=1 Tax=Cotesia glomerata TaxID=32391 RepID=A0AAV7J8I9_COTGL|nr:hypothetical protein KQX54_002663 [Cotesia glomerata]KAH0568118.1 hypothetical protein KQX54_018439 [Cotesia glomerata]
MFKEQQLVINFERELAESSAIVVRIRMYSLEERLELAAEVLKLKERVHNLKNRKPKSDETSEEINQKIKIAKQKYQDKKYELLIICSRERFVEDLVEEALL